VGVRHRAIISSPALNGSESAYFSSLDGWFYALSLDGTLRWRLRTGGISESSPIVAADGTIYIGVNHQLWAISADGKQKWTRGFQQTIQSPPLALSDGSVCCNSIQGLLADFDPQNELRWKYDCLGYGYSSPAVSSQGTIFLSDKGFFFSALPGAVPLGKSSWPKFRGNSRNTGNGADSKGP